MQKAQPLHRSSIIRTRPLGKGGKSTIGVLFFLTALRTGLYTESAPMGCCQENHCQVCRDCQDIHR